MKRRRPCGPYVDLYKYCPQRSTEHCNLLLPYGSHDFPPWVCTGREDRYARDAVSVAVNAIGRPTLSVRESAPAYVSACCRGGKCSHADVRFDSLAISSGDTRAVRTRKDADFIRLGFQAAAEKFSVTFEAQDGLPSSKRDVVRGVLGANGRRYVVKRMGLHEKEIAAHWVLQDAADRCRLPQWFVQVYDTVVIGRLDSGDAYVLLERAEGVDIGAATSQALQMAGTRAAGWQTACASYEAGLVKVVLMLSLLQKHGFLHGDLHSGNILMSPIHSRDQNGLVEVQREHSLAEVVHSPEGPFAFSEACGVRLIDFGFSTCPMERAVRGAPRSRIWDRDLWTNSASFDLYKLSSSLACSVSGCSLDPGCDRWAIVEARLPVLATLLKRMGTWGPCYQNTPASDYFGGLRRAVTPGDMLRLQEFVHRHRAKSAEHVPATSRGRIYVVNMRAFGGVCPSTQRLCAARQARAQGQAPLAVLEPVPNSLVQPWDRSPTATRRHVVVRQALRWAHSIAWRQLQWAKVSGVVNGDFQISQLSSYEQWDCSRAGGDSTRVKELAHGLTATIARRRALLVLAAAQRAVRRTLQDTRKASGTEADGGSDADAARVAATFCEELRLSKGNVRCILANKKSDLRHMSVSSKCHDLQTGLALFAKGEGAPFGSEDEHAGVPADALPDSAEGLFDGQRVFECLFERSADAWTYAIEPNAVAREWMEAL